MKTAFTCLLSIAFFASATAQQAYIDSIQDFRNHYVGEHEVVKGADRSSLQFFPIDPSYRVLAKFERIEHGNWFQMSTSGKEKQTYRKYGKLIFTIHGKTQSLFVYQSQSLMDNKQYKDYLFIPFTDASSGVDSYGGGRYLDYMIGDIKNNQLELDFNKAYNPYCAYTTGYNCPIPPRENDLSERIDAGEKNFGKRTH